MSSKFEIFRTLGVCYYPEHWPEEQWEIDARFMVQSGLSWVRIGEFAWSRLEPKPGTYEWGWMDRAIKTLGEAGLKIILGTPTATPPRWMLEKHPDMLALDANDKPRKFGSRRHYCFSHHGYREECTRITQVLGERYGANPYVCAWQTDNEYGCHSTTLSYSLSALAEFRIWLEKKYQSPAALNTAWGNVFWSMEYDDFAQIDLPNLTVTEANPSHVMDFRRFSSDMVIEFNQIYTKILRTLTKAPLLHNYMGRITDFDHFGVGDDLDIATWDSYPLGFLEDRSGQSESFKEKYMRQGDPDFQAFHHDLYRYVGKGRWWVMEQQPGPVNWAPYNPAPLAGMVRLWTWEAFAHGAEMVSYFRWRQAPFAQEQMHAGLLRPDRAPAPGLKEAVQVAKELEQMPELDFKQASIALVFDYQSAWAWETQPQGESFDYFGLVFDFYRALRKLGQSIDIVSPDCQNLNDYKLVLIPGLYNAPSDLLAALKDFEGLAILGPRFGSKTKDMQIPKNLPPNIPGFDCVVDYVQSLRPGSKTPLDNGGNFVNWIEKLKGSASIREPNNGGDAAIMASDNFWYLAGWPDEQAMARILGEACDQQNIATYDLPEGVRMRDGLVYRYVFNYGTMPAQVFGQTISPAGVGWHKYTHKLNA